MDTTKLVILETSDLHGSIYPVSYADQSCRDVGLGKAATLIRREQAAGNQILLIDDGDLIQGTPLLYHYVKCDHKRPNPMVLLENRLGYDGAVIGNHDFNFGRAVLEKTIRNSDFPWLSANIVSSETGQPYFGRPYLIKEFANGVRVAVLGLTTRYIPVWEKPENILGMRFDDPVATARRWIPRLKNEGRADVVVVAYHGGFERDPDSGEATETPDGENEGYRICTDVPGVDVLLTGHQHRRISGKIIHGVTIVQPGVNGKYLGKVVVDLASKGERWQITGKRSGLLSVSGVPADRQLLRLTDPYEADTEAWLNRPLGRIEGDMRVTDPMDVRTRDHPLIEFINWLQMKVSGVDISLTALFDNASPGLPEHVTMRDIMANYIYPNTLKVIRISGRDMRAALERSASYFMLLNGKVTVSPSFTTPKPQHYNYDMWEGIHYIMDISKPVGSRIVKLEYHGAPVTPDGRYDVVMNNYRSGGGGDYQMFRGRPVIKDIPVDVAEIMADAFEKQKVIQARTNHNWKLVYGPYHRKGTD
ncbi:bifunctional metallophosphatase/5'-nucleotidase [Sporolactobacillus vineae]|uniref:bifunctional metallophosphatase/5'-nucleotidase n=1 Tax=Sporolactobacillus vineae TaxID=444463 RepID=UPI000289E318|nr:bifunctional UDP-sugar hydrolase/5'-nucleotidase [Sporolactobacillus vineae]